MAVSPICAAVSKGEGDMAAAKRVQPPGSRDPGAAAAMLVSEEAGMAGAE